MLILPVGKLQANHIFGKLFNRPRRPKTHPQFNPKPQSSFQKARFQYYDKFLFLAAKVWVSL